MEKNWLTFGLSPFWLDCSEWLKLEICLRMFYISGADDICLRLYCGISFPLWDGTPSAGADKIQHWCAQCDCQPTGSLAFWSEALQNVWCKTQDSSQISRTSTLSERTVMCSCYLFK